jgi:hypothetical protein
VSPTWRSREPPQDDPLAWVRRPPGRPRRLPSPGRSRGGGRRTIGRRGAPGPARRTTPFRGPASPRGYRSRRQRKYCSFTVLPQAGTAQACGHHREEKVITMAAPGPGTSWSSSASSRASRAPRRSRPATPLSAIGWACTTRAGGGRARDRGGTGRPHGHRCQIRQRVADRPGGRRICLLRPRPRLRVQRSDNLTAKVVARPVPDTRRQEDSGPEPPGYRRTHLALTPSITGSA